MPFGLCSLLPFRVGSRARYVLVVAREAYKICPQSRGQAAEKPCQHGLSLEKLLDEKSSFEIFADDDLFNLESQGIELSDGEREEIAKRKSDLESTIRRAVAESFGAVKARESIQFAVQLYKSGYHLSVTSCSSDHHLSPHHHPVSC